MAGITPIVSFLTKLDDRQDAISRVSAVQIAREARGEH